MIRLSVVVITLNEEQNIARCLESVAGLADECVIVDSGSTDRTKEICFAHGATFIVNPFENHIAQKNFSLQQTSFELILSLDADEALSKELFTSIKSVKENPQHDSYYFNRQTSYCGKWIRHGGWYPDRKLRLFKKGTGIWGGENPHDKFIPHSQSTMALLKGDLLHYSYYSVGQHIAQINKFTEISADEAFNKGKRSSLLIIIIKPQIRFIRDYLFHLGILDGYYGFIIARLSSYATFLKYLRLLEIQKKNN